MRPVTLITGASSGIGAELAHVFAEHGHELVLTARREAELEALASAIAAAGYAKPLVLSADLTKRDAVEQIKSQLLLLDIEPDNVVNNAGFGLAGKANELDRDDQLAMVDLNMRALTELSLAFADSLVRHRGGILNVGSIAGFLPGPGMAVYYASKAYVLSFSEALHEELRARGVRVTVLCPGPVATGFQARAGLRPGGIEGGGLLALPARRVAEIGYAGLVRGKRVVVAGFANKLAVFFMGLVPHALLLPIVASSMRRAGRI